MRDAGTARERRKGSAATGSPDIRANPTAPEARSHPGSARLRSRLPDRPFQDVSPSKAIRGGAHARLLMGDGTSAAAPPLATAGPQSVRSVEHPVVEADVRALVGNALLAESRAPADPCRFDYLHMQRRFGWAPALSPCRAARERGRPPSQRRPYGGALVKHLRRLPGFLHGAHLLRRRVPGRRTQIGPWISPFSIPY